MVKERSRKIGAQNLSMIDFYLCQVTSHAAYFSELQFLPGGVSG
ncbi:hypothetical protein [Sulfidibacter corallicola]|nr:hypothetical protein [Sulfidibacter corallicola]